MISGSLFIWHQTTIHRHNTTAFVIMLIIFHIPCGTAITLMQDSKVMAVSSGPWCVHMIWSYGSWIYNYLSKLWVLIPPRWGILDTILCDKFSCDLWQVGGFLLALRFPPPIKVTAMILTWALSCYHDNCNISVAF
jgi:hypothetical protein